MEDMRCSSLLLGMFEYAKTLGNNSNCPLTAEGFVITVIDCITGKTSMQINDEQKQQLKGILSTQFEAKGYTLEEAREILLKRLGATAIDSECKSAAQMRDRIVIAKSQAQRQGFEELNPVTLLESIFGDAFSSIKGLFAKKDSVREKEETESKGTKFPQYTPQQEKKNPFDTPSESIQSSAPAAPEEPEPEFDGDPKEAIKDLTDRVKDIHAKLKSEIFGQDYAISVFTSGYFQAELRAMTDKDRVRPSATYLFAGPPGVGKTFLAEQAAAALERPFMRFDMSEYSDKEANIEFCGSDKVYKDAKEGNVTSFVSKNPKCVLLFDEIEKAHINVIHLFLQILDAGRIRDNFTDKEVSFRDTILIFTTNAGKQLYEGTDALDFSGVSRKAILNSLKKDINPATGTPYFPGAICSRFASGNVVMFNHITAHNLRAIAKKEILKHATQFEEKIGIKINIDERVYTAVLFAEGGAADARTIKSRAETFFNDELFELFRLMDSDITTASIAQLKSISFDVDLDERNSEVYSLFESQDEIETLVFSPDNNFEACAEKSSAVKFVNSCDLEGAKQLLRERDISFILLDWRRRNNGAGSCLNIEDEDSVSRDFFWYVKEFHADVPVFMIMSEGNVLNSEEQLSFTRQGVRGFVTFSMTGDSFDGEMSYIKETIYHQRSMIALAKANKLVSFETSQFVDVENNTAQIKMFDFELDVAVDAEDSKNILSRVSKPDVSFDQVFGAEDAKKELLYFINFLKNPKKFMGTGVGAPKGVLLYGPPGTGKTMLAKAMAHESDVTFINAEGNQFLKKYVGEGPEAMHEIFRTARKYAPAILFIDEIDAFAKERDGSENNAVNEEVLTAFLAEMDGFKNDTSKPVFVLAATNYDVEPNGKKSLDPAFLRRFDRRIYIDLPSRDERMKYIKYRMAELSAFKVSDKTVDNIVLRSTGMSLAQLASVIELALRTAIRDGNTEVTDEIFEEAFESFNSGEEKKWSKETLERVARHEAGHAFVCWKGGETPSYITIVARGDHGGYMQHDSNEDKQLITRQELISRIRTSLGGRAAEIVYYGDEDGISTGASGDLVNATNLARHMICLYGMDDNFGLAVYDGESVRSSELSSRMYNTVNELLAREMKNAIDIIRENRATVDALVEKLMSVNHLTGDEIKAIFEGTPVSE